MWYKIKPLDTLFFRDGRPFSMGSETWANPIFPPYPSTVYGAILTWLIFERGSLKEFEDGKYEIELGRIIKSEKNNLYYIDCINKPEIFISDYLLERILINKNDFEFEECNEFLDVNSLKDYLMGNEKQLKFTEKTEIFYYEKKTGIKRSRKTLSSEEGHLYRIPMIRLEKRANLFVEIDGLNRYPEEGLLQIGGEGKTARIEKIENDDPFKVLSDLNFKFENKIFKLYLATPAIFEKGWLPDWIDETNFEGNYKGINLKLIACSIGKFKLIGGWDLANKKPKPMHKAVPAGSVYYFKILDGTPAERIKEVFYLKNISDINPEEGFGLSLVGEVKK